MIIHAVTLLFDKLITKMKELSVVIAMWLSQKMINDQLNLDVN